MFLATVMDLFSRRIIGWEVSSHHKSELVLNAFKDAQDKTGENPGISHCDQGSEYTSTDYEQVTKENKIRLSFSAKASPWQNGFQESFYDGFKLDLGDIDRFKTKGELIEAIHLTIHYYNNDRIHSKLKTSPQKFYEAYLKRVNQVKTQLEGETELFKERGT